jgi:hypothetical protein
VITAQVRYFAARGTPVEWKLYDYDQPADLAQRLVAAGFVADDDHPQADRLTHRLAT